MLEKIYLKVDSNCLEETKKVLLNLRGAKTVETGYLDRKKESTVISFEYENSDVSLNTIINYYLKSIGDLIPSIYYFNEYEKLKLTRNKLVNKNKIGVFKYQSYTKLSEAFPTTSDNLNKVNVKRYDSYDLPLSMVFPARISYFLIFLVGLGIVFINELIYIFPLIGLTNLDLNNLQASLLDYDGFVSLASKLFATMMILLLFRNIILGDAKWIKKKWWLYLIIVIIGFGLIALDNVIFDKIYELLKIETDAKNEEQIFKVLNGKSKIPFTISIAIFTPFVEEFVFRKLAFQTVKYFKIPRIVGVVIVSVFFALIHCTTEDFTQLSSWMFFLQYFTLSLIITITYEITDENIFASTLIHALNNILGLFLA